MKRTFYLTVSALIVILGLSSCDPSCVTSGFSPMAGSVETCGPITISWPADPDAIDYDVYFDAGTTATTLVSQYQSGTTYTTDPLGPGTYTWKIIPNGLLGSASGCSSYSFTIPATANPTAAISAPMPDTICAGTPITFSSSITGGGTSPTYQWYYNGAPVGGNTPTYTLNNYAQGDSVRMVLTSSVTGGCNTSNIASSMRTTISSVVLTPQAVTAHPTTDTVFCNGGSATMTTTATGSYQWQRNGADWPGATQSTYTTQNSGDWTVKVSTPTGRCPSISNIVHLNLNASPNPLLSANGNMLQTDNTYTTYQWYRNNVAISGATSSTYSYTHDGFYKVYVTTDAGCNGMSAAFPVNSLKVGTVVNTEELTIFPNPTTGMITVNTSALLNIIIQNIAGKLMMKKQATNSIDITSLPNGLYIIKLLDKNNNVLKADKVIKR